MVVVGDASVVPIVQIVVQAVVFVVQSVVVADMGAVTFTGEFAVVGAVWVVMQGVATKPTRPNGAKVIAAVARAGFEWSHSRAGSRSQVRSCAQSWSRSHSWSRSVSSRSAAWSRSRAGSRTFRYVEFVVVGTS